MPIREFRCQKCGHKFETLILPGESENGVACPKCQAGQVKRCMSVCNGRMGQDGTQVAATGGVSGCGSCSGGHCATCH